MVSFAHVETVPRERFDLSGFDFAPDGALYVVSDKSPKIFRLSPPFTGTLVAEPIFDISTQIKADDYDLESIRRSNRGTYLISNEAGQFIYEWNPDLKTVKRIAENSTHLLLKRGLNRTYGVEGLCLYQQNLILNREFKPAEAIQLTFPDGNFLHAFTLDFETVENDLTDCIGDGETLFLLNRNHSRVLISTTSGNKLQVNAQWDFSWVKKDARFRYWLRDQQTGVQHDEWGSAEAFTMDEKFVYVGFDNNGQALMANNNETRPVMMIFERPPAQTLLVH